MKISSRMEKWNQVASLSVKPEKVSTVIEKSKGVVSTVNENSQEVISLSQSEIERRKRVESVKTDLKMAELYLQKSRNAERSNNQFALTYIEFYKVMASPVCAYSGKTFSRDPESPYSRSLERINPKLGYTPDNTIAVTKAANNQKSNLDAFVKSEEIPAEMKIKLMNKAIYQLQKQIKIKKG